MIRKASPLLGAGGGGGGGAKLDPLGRKPTLGGSEKSGSSSRSGTSASRNLIRRGVLAPSTIDKKSDRGLLSRFGNRSKIDSSSVGKSGKIVRSSGNVRASIKSTDSAKVKALGAGGGAGVRGGRTVRSSADADSIRTPRSVANVPSLENAANSARRAGGRRESGWSRGRGHDYYDDHHHHRHHSHRSHLYYGLGFGYLWGYHNSYHVGFGYSRWGSSFWLGAYDPWYYDPYPYYYSSGFYSPFVSYRRSYIGLGTGYYCPHHYLNLHYCGCNHVQVVDPGPAVIEEVEVPPAAPEPAGDGGGAAVPPPPAEGGEPPAEAGSLDGLRPAQLRFWSGLESFRGGSYNDSAEAFYNALLEDPGNGVISILLSESLFAIGEYRYAARYLREALADWEEFPRYQWSPAALYSKAEDFPARLKSLEEEASAHPENEDLQVVLAYEHFVHGNPAAAGGIFGTLATSASDETTRKLSARFLKRIETVSSGEGKEAAPLPETPTSRFLKSFSLEDLKTLKMR
ncbi:MAG: tetratricopeptide repeat protein [Planctomycetota bacterium]|nr:tetratricopeptide repeat protein [Planctomycetota bacterium]